jgi:hypothetical protein
MPRNPARNHSREYIAQIAARLMAEDGIEDYAVAKRKAARQAGATESKHLPDNEEVEAALRAYRAIYKPDHPGQLLELRRLALQVMLEFAQFNPHLTGSILHGGAGKYAGIHLQAFIENAKAAEHFLFDRNIAFQTREICFYAGDLVIRAPVLVFERGESEICLTVLSTRELHTQLRTSPDGRVVRRADRKSVEAMIALS